MSVRPVPRPDSGGRSTRRLARPAPPPRGKTKLVAIGAVAAGLLGIAVVLIVAFGGKKKPRPIPPPEPVAVREEPAPAPPPPPPPPPPPKPKETPKPPPPPVVDEQAQFRERLARKKDAAARRLEQVRASLDEERKELAQAADARRARLARKPVLLALRSGETIPGALLRDYTPHDVEFQAGGSTRRVPWDAITPASLSAAADVMFDADDGALQFDRGKFFIARRLWKEARAAFEKAAGLGYEDKVAELREILERVESGHGFFRGQARRTAHDWLMLTYDFREDGQLRDFSPGMSWKEGAATLEGKVFLRGGDPETPLAFEEELTLEARIVPEAPSLTIHLFSGPPGGYELSIGPKGTDLVRLPGAGEKKAKPRTVGRNAAATLPAGKPVHLRLQVRERRFKLLLDDREALAAEDPVASPEEERRYGPLGLSVPGGKLRLHAPFAVHGRMRPHELEKRVGEMEVLLRRAVDEDLARLARKREDAMAYEMLDKPVALTLTADDPYFAFRIKTNEDLSRYENLKKSMIGFLTTRDFERGAGFDVQEGLDGLDRLIARYPDVPSLYYLRALLRRERQEHALLRADVARALELFPDFAEALVLESSFRLEEGDLEGARRRVDRALEVRPDYSPAYVQRAFVGFTRSSGFLDDLELAVRLDPANDRATSTLRVLKIQSRGPRDLGCRFEHETEHYRILTDISEEAARRYGAMLEAAWGYFAETMKAFGPPRKAPKPRVAIFNTAENYYTYFELLSESRGEYTLGVFRPQLNELVLFESLDVEESVHTLFHEAFHHFTTLLIPDSPPYWWNEGMAEYMGGIVVKDGRVVRTGVLQVERLRLLKFVRAVDQTVPFARIMTETPREFYGPGAILRYAQAWSMIHFFHEHENGRHRPLLDRYFSALRARKTPREAYEATFGPVAESLEKEWKSYVGRLKLPGE